MKQRAPFSVGFDPVFAAPIVQGEQLQWGINYRQHLIASALAGSDCLDADPSRREEWARQLVDQVDAVLDVLDAEKQA